MTATDGTNPLPDHVGVLGGGRMGSGIAHAFCVSGATVTIVERDEPSADAAREHVRAALQTEHRPRAPPSEILDALTARVDGGHRLRRRSPDAGLVVEAVPEDVRLKTDALRRVEEHARRRGVARHQHVVAVGDVARRRAGAAVSDCAACTSSTRCPRSGLVEIVVGAAATPNWSTSPRGWVKALGKTPIVVADAPGFASSRLGVALGLEAIRMVEEGVASAEDIDAAMVLGYKHPVGPLRLTDIVGLDVRLGIAEYLHEKLGERFASAGVARAMVAARRPRPEDRDSGFYDWTATEGRPQ